MASNFYHAADVMKCFLQGVVPRGNATNENIRKLGLRDGQVVYKCPKCISIKPERAHHCRFVRMCVSDCLYMCVHI